MGWGDWLRTWLAIRFIFFPEKVIELYPTEWQLPFEEVVFESNDRLKLHGWFFPGRLSHRTLIFFHGNAGNIGDRLPKIARLHGLGMNIFIFDYRGYGGSEGKLSFEGVVEDSQAAYRYVASRGDVDSSHIVLYGESLGGAMALQVAREQKHSGIILESTFTSIQDMARAAYPFIPRLLVPNIYRSIDIIRELREPVLIIHGTKDDVVPYAMGERLYQAAPHPKRFVPVSGAGHSDIYEVAPQTYLQAIDDFLLTVGD